MKQFSFCMREIFQITQLIIEIFYFNFKIRQSFQKKYQQKQIQYFFCKKQQVLQFLTIQIEEIKNIMGNWFKRQPVQTKIIYVQDPQIMRQLDESRLQIQELTKLVRSLQIQLEEVYSQAKLFKSPTHYEQLKADAFKIFLYYVQSLKFEQKIPKKYGERHHVLIGNISSGKSSLINYFCGTDLNVGIGEVTQEVKKVAVSPNQKIHIWDSPGFNDDFEFYDSQVLAYFHSADRIFILYPDSLKSCKQMLQVMYKIKPSNTFLIRTQCDRGEVGQCKTVQQELQTDRSLLSEWKVKFPVYGTSTHRKIDYLDNKKVKNLVIGNE